MKSPKKPWKPGVQPEYTHLRVVLNICQDKFGNVWSDHTFLSPEDERLAGGMPSSGHNQVAHALMSEALRREAFLQALAEMSVKSDFIQQWKNGNKATRAVIQSKLEASLVELVRRTAEKNAAGVVEGVLAMLADQV